MNEAKKSVSSMPERRGGRQEYLFPSCSDALPGSAIEPNAQVGDVVSIPVEPKKFGRIAAQAAKR